jgi:sporulation protein YlmC with PRC-barrel domain
VDLVREFLDKKVVDRNGREIGRVDSIVVDVRDGEPPRISAIELGPAVLAHRVSRALGRVMAGVEHALDINGGRPYRIEVGSVIDVDNQVKVDRTFGETPPAEVERKLRRWAMRLLRLS